MKMWCLAKVMVLTSDCPGGFALQPTKPVRAIANARTHRRMSVHHMEFQCHGAMAGAAKDRAMADEIARPLWGELNFSCIVRANADLDVQIAKANAVRNVGTFYDKDDWLSQLQGDFGGVECKPLGRNF